SGSAEKLRARFRANDRLPRLLGVSRSIRLPARGFLRRLRKAALPDWNEDQGSYLTASVTALQSVGPTGFWISSKTWPARPAQRAVSTMPRTAFAGTPASPSATAIAALTLVTRFLPMVS